MLPEAAVIVMVPGSIAVASPIEPVALLMEATEADEEDHVTVEVRSCVELSL